MGTVIRANISKKGKWYISKHRYYELKHFCLQYSEYKKELAACIKVSGSFCDISSLNPTEGDRTGNTAVKTAYLSSKIDIIEKTAHETDPELATYILKAVTEGYAYEYLHMVLGMPCSRTYYYDKYRKFFYLLSQKFSPLR